TAQAAGSAAGLSADDRRLLRLARADAEKAVEALKALRDESPGETALANELGRAGGHLRLGLARPGAPEQAGEGDRPGVSQFGTLAEQSARTVDYRHQLALARGNLGLHLLAERDYAGADKALGPARQGLEALVKDFPDMVMYRLDLVRLYNSQGL